MRKMIQKLKAYERMLTQKLQRKIDGLSPRTKVFTLLGCTAFLGLISLYSIIISVYEIGKSEGKALKIEHIKSIGLKNENHKDTIMRKEGSDGNNR